MSTEVGSLHGSTPLLVLGIYAEVGLDIWSLDQAPAQQWLPGGTEGAQPIRLSQQPILRESKLQTCVHFHWQVPSCEFMTPLQKLHAAAIRVVTILSVSEDADVK